MTLTLTDVSSMTCLSRASIQTVEASYHPRQDQGLNEDEARALPARRWARSPILTALFFCAESLRPEPCRGSATLSARPRDMDLHDRARGSRDQHQHDRYMEAGTAKTRRQK